MSDPASPALFSLAGKVCVVTGGGRGLGLGIATGFAAAGAHVVIAGRSRETLDAAAAKLGSAAMAVVADVSIEDDVERLRDAVLERHRRIDVLVNNAGVNAIYKPIERTTLDEWRTIIDVNLTGVFLCCKHLGAAMHATGGGSIVTISSVAGHVGLRKSAAYCATKGGVELFTKALALDWAPKGVRVNCIAPGYFETDLTQGIRDNPALGAQLLAQTPLGRFGAMSDIAGAALYLASDASGYVTGQSLVVDGGWTAQ